MRFQTKMILGYAAFVLMAALILGLGYYRFSVKQYEKGEENNLAVTAQQVTIQMDEMFKIMEMTIHYILSDSNVLSSINMLAQAEDKNIAESYQSDAVKKILTGIRTDFIVNNFYRVIVFNQAGNAAASSNEAARSAVTPEDLAGMPWLAKADSNPGKAVIAEGHTDTWGFHSNPQVFSLIKAVVGKNMGYIEVQKEVKELESIVQLPRPDLEYAIFVNTDKLLCSTVQGIQEKELVKLAEEDGEFVKTFYFGSDGTERLVAKSISDDFAMSILVFEDMEVIRQNSAYLRPMVFMIVTIFFVISMIFVILISRFLSKPIRELRKVMEDTRIENIGENMVTSSSIDEIEALNVSYQDVLERLRISMLKERRMSMLQLQAQFDTLQSQVNPHFLYNVLNVIAARGMSDGDEVICEMCGSLASMLRYSTNTKTRYAMIQEELTYLEQYFCLQKARYEHKIEFTISVAQEIQGQIIPKMVFQQIVENCISHAFTYKTDLMQITIIGWEENDMWYCTIMDNGKGIEADVLGKLRDNFEKVKSRILKQGQNIELEIGGMGLVNTYARLLLLYNEQLIFDIRNRESGMEVVIGAPMRKE